LIGKATINAASAVPTAHRYRLEEFTGDAPIRRASTITLKAAEVVARMAFLRRPRNSIGLRHSHTLENPDMGSIVAEAAAALHIFE
jgi:hypothetical protein